MKLSYTFRDKDFNKSVVSVHWFETLTPADFAIMQSAGVLISALSDAQLIEATITYPGTPSYGSAALTSNVNRLFLLCCALETGDTHLIAIPSARTEYLATDEQGRTLPVIPLDSAVMTSIQGLCDTGVDEYGRRITSIVIIGLAV